MPRSAKPKPSRTSRAESAHFGAKVRAVRESWDWSQKSLAEAVGASRSTVNRIENGHALMIEPSIIVRLADVLGVSADDLLRDDRPIPPHAYEGGHAPKTPPDED